tara:strand:- start:95 stop:592 length:498 start_codon:yes stop_codon:yes gene_type:complete
MNLINWIRQPALMWSFTTQKVGLSRDLFYAPSRENAQASIMYHMNMMFGDDLEGLMWENNADSYDVLLDISRDSNGEIVEVETYGYLKLVNDKIKTIDEVMDNYAELSEEEKQRKQQRIDEYVKKLTGGKSEADPEDYYGYNPSNRNPFTPNRNYPTFSENQFEE